MSGSSGAALGWDNGVQRESQVWADSDQGVQQCLTQCQCCCAAILNLECREDSDMSWSIHGKSCNKDFLKIMILFLSCDMIFIAVKSGNPNACPAFYSFFWCCPKGIIDTKIGMPLLLLFLKYVYEQEILMHKSPILIIPLLKAGTPRTRIWSLWLKCRKWIELSNCWTRKSWKIIQLVS